VLKFDLNESKFVFGEMGFVSGEICCVVFSFSANVYSVFIAVIALPVSVLDLLEPIRSRKIVVRFVAWSGSRFQKRCQGS
jgi:NhaP-type Na+/H+ and K+/H+ antiporter